MGIKMNMFAGNQMTAANDGMIYDKMIASSGILKGCEMTFMGANQIHIAKGYIIIKGRLCTILEETMQVEMANTDVEMPGRLYIHADLADAISPVKIVSVVAATLPALIQDEDFNFDNGIYELELGTYTAGRVAIRDFKSTCEMVDDMGGTRKEIDKINGNITVLSQKITSFENTKSEIAASGLGAALGLAASNTWAQIVAKIKSIANRGVLNWSGSNTTFAVPAGYYPGGTLDSRPSYNSGYNAGVTAADNRANVNSVNYKTGYNAGVSAGRTLKSKTYTIASETSSSTVYDMDGASHVGWRIAVPAITDTHCIVGAHWKDSGGNQYDYYLSPDGAISNDPNTYAINIARIPGNTSDWATKTSGTIYLYVDSSKSRSHSITVYYC